MGQLQEKIVADINVARRERNASTLSSLTTLKGELDRKGKVLTDEQVVIEVKKYIENCKLVGNFTEASLLEGYLPKQLDQFELNAIIIKVMSENAWGRKDMGKIMGALKENYAGQYDGKLASELIKTILG